MQFGTHRFRVTLKVCSEEEKELDFIRTKSFTLVVKNCLARLDQL